MFRAEAHCAVDEVERIRKGLSCLIKTSSSKLNVARQDLVSNTGVYSGHDLELKFKNKTFTRMRGELTH